MFGQNKQLEEVKELLDNLNGRVKNQNMEIAKLKESNDELTTELEDSRNNLKTLKEQLTFLTQNVKQINEELCSELTDMKLFFSKTKKDLVNNLSAEFSTEMQETTKTIHQDLESFKELKTNIDSLNNESNSMKIEILKFMDIANKIKSADFDMSKYATVLEKGDKEKLDLMKKIDSMERLIAKNRRNH